MLYNRHQIVIKRDMFVVFNYTGFVWTNKVKQFIHEINHFNYSVTSRQVNFVVPFCCWLYDCLINSTESAQATYANTITFSD